MSALAFSSKVVADLSPHMVAFLSYWAFLMTYVCT